MEALKLYEILERDFINEKISDEWAKFMGEVEGYLCKNFLNRSMGLVCDFTEEINKVYTAVFPTEEVMKKIIEDKVENAMLFVHHPSIWDIRKPGSVFYQMNTDCLESFKKNKISIYNLHTPLDNYGDYSTSKSLAEALGIKVEKPFAASGGALCGIIGSIDCTDVKELQQRFNKLLGHETKLHLYGETSIKDGKVAVIAGGGNTIAFVEEMLDNDVKVLITGISACIPRYFNVHQFEKENKINVIGGSHYSTEKFACKIICEYFHKLGLPAEFIEGEPILEDM